MDDRDAESPEVREAVNATLRDVLYDEGWGKSRWDSLVKNLNKEFGIETDIMGLAQRAPGLVEMFQLGALIDNGLVGEEIRVKLKEIIWKMVRIAYHAGKGDERAIDQLNVIHKVAHPDSYELPATIIKNLANSYHTSPHLARAWKIRGLMLNLSYVVEPTRKDKSILKSPIKLSTMDLRSYDPDLYAKATKHIKKGSTLQSLAIDIYIEELNNEGITIDPRQLKLDLQKLKQWEAVNNPNKSYPLRLWNVNSDAPPANIPDIPIFSEGWKKLWRRGDKK
jgi:hypothetical protein